MSLENDKHPRRLHRFPIERVDLQSQISKAIRGWDDVALRIIATSKLLFSIKHNTSYLEPQ